MPLFRRVNRLASSVLTLRSSKKTARNKTKRKMAHQSAIPWVMMLTFHLWNERLIPSSEEVPASEEVFASITELCLSDFFIFPLLWHNRTAVTFSVLCSCWDCYAFRLTVAKDFNGSMLVEKIITYRRGPLTFGKWTRKAFFRSGLAV